MDSESGDNVDDKLSSMKVLKVQKDDEMNQEDDSRDKVMHIGMSDL